jgi:Ca-activated chloride channel family protein
MFYFADPHFLYLLIIVPLLIFLFFWQNSVRDKKMQAFGAINTLRQLMPNVSKYRGMVKFYLSLLALSLIVVALARPQFVHKSESIQKRGIEAMLVLDISNSMLARDIEPNRLEYSKLLLSNLIDKMTNDKIGLIIFAGDSYIQMPITSDNVSAKMFLRTIKPSLISRQGTAIGSAVELAVKCFGDETKNIGRAIFLITDGENHEDNAVEAVKLAEKKGITVNVIGIGSTDGSPIPVEGTMNFIKDRDGNVVVTKLNEDMCRQIAAEGKGIYVHATNTGSVIKALEKEIDKMQKGETKAFSSSYEDKFYIPVWLALFVVLIEYFLLNRKNKRLNRINLFGKI